ncbi:MAG: DUF3592 domain-containing protein [Pseudomonadota bacterium]
MLNLEGSNVGKAVVIFMVTLLSVFVAAGVGMLGYAGYAWSRTVAAQSWPTTDGEVLTSTLDIDRDSDGDTYRAKVSYQYSVDGIVFKSDRLSFGFSGTDNKAYHDAIVDRLTQGTHIGVRYDPKNPEVATLAPGPNKGLIFLTIFGIMWSTFTAGFILLLIMGGGTADPFLHSIIIHS